jgi:hypothetical protein
VTPVSTAAATSEVEPAQGEHEQDDTIRLASTLAATAIGDITQDESMPAAFSAAATAAADPMASLDSTEDLAILEAIQRSVQPAMASSSTTMDAENQAPTLESSEEVQMQGGIEMSMQTATVPVAAATAAADA